MNQLNKPTILLVEDMPAIRALLTNLFRQDYDIVTACNGLEAWELVQESKFDLIISDMSMPGMTGDQFVRKVKAEISNEIPVIMQTSSGYRAQGLLDEGVADAIMIKPYNLVDLEDAVSRILAIGTNNTKTKTSSGHTTIIPKSSPN